MPTPHPLPMMALNLEDLNGMDGHENGKEPTRDLNMILECLSDEALGEANRLWGTFQIWGDSEI